MKIKTADLTGHALDRAVARCEPKEFFDWQSDFNDSVFTPSTD